MNSKVLTMIEDPIDR